LARLGAGGAKAGRSVVWRHQKGKLGCSRYHPCRGNHPSWGKSKLTTMHSPTCQSASGCQGRETPPGSDISLNQALVQSTTPFLSRRTRAGIVISPSRWNKEVPRDPVADLCGFSVQNDMASKYLIVSASEAHLKTNTMAKSLRLCQNLSSDMRNEPQCRHHCDPK
jgi:hypothetical protein